MTQSVAPHFTLNWSIDDFISPGRINVNVNARFNSLSLAGSGPA